MVIYSCPKEKEDKEMENVDQMTYSAVTLVYLAQDVVEAAKKGRKEAAKMSWYELVGAATM